MEDFQGVSEGASPSAETSPSASPAETTQVETPVSPTEQVTEGATPPVEGAATTPPSEPVAAPDDLDPAGLEDEKVRNAFIHMRQAKRDAEQYKTQAEPVYSWIEKRGGLEPVQSDVSLVDGLYASSLEERIEQFYKPLSQNEGAYTRILDDLSTVGEMQDRALLKLGVPEAEIAQAKQFLTSGAWKNAPATAPASAVSAETLALIADPALKEVYKLSNPNARSIADKLDGEELNEFLQDQKLKQDVHKWQQDQTQARQQETQKAREAQVLKQKSDTYLNVRTIVQNSLQKVFAGNEKALNFVMGATEGVLWSSPEGNAQWEEITALIESGDMRQVNTKLPQIVARAQAIATEQAKYLNEKEEKARGFDEIMRLSNPEEIAAYLAKRRGGGVQPTGGQQVQTNGSSQPLPKEAGRYDPRNILSYFPRQ